MAHDPQSDKFIALIDQSKALNAKIDQLRLEALNRSLAAGVLDEFPDLKLWLPDALNKNLIDKPKPDKSTHSDNREETRDRVCALQAEVAEKEAQSKKLRDEINALR